MTRRANANLSRDEAARLRDLAAYHGYAAATGPHAGQGSAFALTMAIVAGDVQLLSLDPEEVGELCAWLDAQAAAAADGLAELLGGVAAQLRHSCPGAGQ